MESVSMAWHHHAVMVLVVSLRDTGHWFKGPFLSQFYPSPRTKKDQWWHHVKNQPSQVTYYNMGLCFLSDVGLQLLIYVYIYILFVPWYPHYGFILLGFVVVTLLVNRWFLWTHLSIPSFQIPLLQVLGQYRWVSCMLSIVRANMQTRCLSLMIKLLFDVNLYMQEERMDFTCTVWRYHLNISLFLQYPK